MEIGRSYINENGVALPGSMCRTGWHLEEDEYQEGSKSTDVQAPEEAPVHVANSHIT